MKPPSVFDYLFGNPLSLALLCLWAANMGYAWYDDRAGGHLPGLCFSLFVAMLSVNSARSLASHRQWNRAWKNAGAQKEGAAKKRLSPKATCVLVGVLALVFCFAWVSDHVNDHSPASGLMAIGLLVGVLAGITWTCFEVARLLRRIRTNLFPHHAELSGEEVVTVCLPVPKHRALPNKALLLPDYCLPLLGRHGVRNTAS